MAKKGSTINTEINKEVNGIELEEEILNEDATTILEAVKRIEEANLWKTLLLQNVFRPGSARPEILASVNEKIKNFAKEQLEYCVGIKQEKSAPLTHNDSLFDSEEVQALKILAAKMLKRNPLEIAIQQYNPSLNVINNHENAAYDKKTKIKNNNNKNKKDGPSTEKVPQPAGYLPNVNNLPSINISQDSQSLDNNLIQSLIQSTLSKGG